MIDHRKESNVRTQFEHCFGKLGAEQLFDISADPGCMLDLAASSNHAGIRTDLRAQLARELERLGDPRMTKNGDVWESYPRFSAMRPELGGFAEQGKYNPKYKNAAAH
jgi:uncharacterized sulfatase